MQLKTKLQRDTPKAFNDDGGLKKRIGACPTIISYYITNYYHVPINKLFLIETLYRKKGYFTCHAATATLCTFLRRLPLLFTTCP